MYFEQGLITRGSKCARNRWCQRLSRTDAVGHGRLYVFHDLARTCLTRRDRSSRRAAGDDNRRRGSAVHGCHRCTACALPLHRATSFTRTMAPSLPRAENDIRIPEGFTNGAWVTTTGKSIARLLAMGCWPTWLRLKRAFCFAIAFVYPWW